MEEGQGENSYPVMANSFRHLRDPSSSLQVFFAWYVFFFFCCKINWWKCFCFFFCSRKREIRVGGRKGVDWNNDRKLSESLYHPLAAGVTHPLKFFFFFFNFFKQQVTTIAVSVMCVFVSMCVTSSPKEVFRNMRYENLFDLEWNWPLLRVPVLVGFWENSGREAVPQQKKTPVMFGHHQHLHTHTHTPMLLCFYCWQLLVWSNLYLVVGGKLSVTQHLCW